MKSVYGYLRVSTVRQGMQGSSLAEQKAAIEQYAAQHGLTVSQWFEERETAAKRGRAVFNRMLTLLRRGSACGVIIHKIDRSARNLKDWADLGELIDRGVELHFAHESLDLHSRGGRLAADIQAVVAADFIRNLRDEVRKGMRGRLKQGLYPLPAPIGYRDQGKAKPKIPNPETAPLVRRLFDCYATGKYNFPMLRKEAERIGLKSRFGGPLSANGLSTLLNNEFYIGIIHIKRTGERFPGIHEPIISHALFEIVKNVLNGRKAHRNLRHDFLFRKRIRCASCSYHVIGECQKGRVYYRCHTPSCQITSLREDHLFAQFQHALSLITPPKSSFKDLEKGLNALLRKRSENAQAATKRHELAIAKIGALVSRLTDLLLDGEIEKLIYHEKKHELIKRRALHEEKIREIADGNGSHMAKVRKFLELLLWLCEREKSLNSEEMIQMAEITTSNLRLEGKNLLIDWKSAYALLREYEKTECSRPRRDRRRTPTTQKCQLSRLSERLLEVL